MRWTSVAISGLGALVLGLAGCQSSKPTLKPEMVEEYNLPSEDDVRWSQPPQYPREVLNKDSIKRPTAAPNLPSMRGGPGGGMGAPMGRPY